MFSFPFPFQTLYTLERLQEITSQEVETPHEQWFQENYGKLITMAMDRLRNPTNPNHPSSSWQPFKQVHKSADEQLIKSAYVEILYFHAQFSSISIKLYIA